MQNLLEPHINEAFVWDPRAGLTSLGAGGATDINDDGLIVGMWKKMGMCMQSYGNRSQKFPASSLSSAVLRELAGLPGEEDVSVLRI